jgi:para-aminobenzoate synthetase/4-amino-4-deoxychorismate lyase
MDRLARIRLRLSRGGKVEVGVSPIDQGEPEPVRVAIDDVPVDPSDVFLFHKTSLRQRYEDARKRHPYADDILLVNTRGEVTESTIANLAVKLDGRWWTPPLGAGLLAGVGRRIALEAGALAERTITVEELRAARSIALVSDSRGWRSAVLVIDA